MTGLIVNGSLALFCLLTAYLTRREVKKSRQIARETQRKLDEWTERRDEAKKLRDEASQFHHEGVAFHQAAMAALERTAEARALMAAQASRDSKETMN